MQNVSSAKSDVQHIELPLGDRSAWFPRNARFDRIARTALRLLDRGESLVCIVDEEAQWLLSAQGLDAEMDPHVSAFRYQDSEVLQDMARMVEAELRVTVLSAANKRLQERLGRLEPHTRLDPVTGCWNVRAFRDLVGKAVRVAAGNQSTLGLCYVRVRNLDALGAADSPGRPDLVRRLLGQVLASRLPAQGALASLGGADFCALVPGAAALEVEDALAAFTYPQLALAAPGLRVELDLHLSFGLALLHEMPAGASATEIWATALAKLGD